MKKKSSILNLNANTAVLIAYLGGLILKMTPTACYFAWGIPLIIYLCENKNEFIKKQSSQATLLYLINALLSILAYILLKLFSPTDTLDIYNMIITGSLFLVSIISLATTIIAVTVIIFAVVATIKTYNYEDYDIPYISKHLPKFRKYLEKLEGKSNKKTKTANKEEIKKEAVKKTKEYKKAKQHKVRTKNKK